MSNTDEDMKTVRHRNPSGLLDMFSQSGIEYTIEAVVESPPSHTEKISRLSERSGVSIESTHKHLRYLDSIRAIELDKKNDEYTLADESIVLQELFHLNSAINKKRS